MNEMVKIRSVKQYFNEFIAEPFKNARNISNNDLKPVKKEILKAFKDEVFGQIYFKLGDGARSMTRDELADLEPVNNILHQAFRKWRRFCTVCSEQGLGGLFGLEDLRDALTEEEDVIEPDPEETVYKDTVIDTVKKTVNTPPPKRPPVDAEEAWHQVHDGIEKIPVAMQKYVESALSDEGEDVTDRIHSVIGLGNEPVYLNGGLKIMEADDHAAVHQS